MRNLPILSAIYHRYKRRRLERRLSDSSTEQVFTEIFQRKRWAGSDSSSGPGSDLEQTRAIARELPGLFEEFGVSTVLDIPCGDLYWIHQVDLEGVRYIGADIVREIVERNRKEHTGENIRFEHLDLIRDDLPRVDLVLCRDCLVHFSYEDIRAALNNICRSGSNYLLATTFADRDDNRDILTGEWRPLNLCAPPLNLPKPIHVINEECTQDGGAYPDKSLGLWRLKDVREAL
jgi:SAM-dependent methyltransferase